ncbi:MAG: hypothetical protein AAF696_37385 [Bacteroidota bacterium]
MQLFTAIILTLGISLFQEKPILENAKKNLVGNNQKEWIFERVEYYLADGQRCAQGITYSFSENGEVVISECIDEIMIKINKNWELQFEEPKDVIIKIGNESSYLIFYKDKDDKSIEHMILRNYKNTKPEENEDRVFTYIVD